MLKFIVTWILFSVRMAPKGLLVDAPSRVASGVRGPQNGVVKCVAPKSSSRAWLGLLVPG